MKAGPRGKENHRWQDKTKRKNFARREGERIGPAGRKEIAQKILFPQKKKSSKSSRKMAASPAG